MRKDILKFTWLTIIAIVPVIAIIVAYVYIDPFRVLHPSDPYFQPSNPMYVGWNKSFVSTETFKKHHKIEKYDSYIFGPSLSIGYKAQDWKKYLSPESKIFHFDASSETLDGILMKMEYIIKSGEKIKNALFILDPEIFRRDNGYTHLYIQHPDITQQHDLISFHWCFFKVFLNREFILSYIDLKENGFKPYMKEKNIFTNEFPSYNGITNEENYPFYDIPLKLNEEDFYKSRETLFIRKYQKGIILKPYFNNDIISKLEKMNEILCSQNTSFKIIFPPLYKLTSLSEKDKNILYHIFNKKNFCDYSGANYLSLDYHSFYDGASHPRPAVCAEILQKAYLIP